MIYKHKFLKLSKFIKTITKSVMKTVQGKSCEYIAAEYRGAKGSNGYARGKIYFLRIRFKGFFPTYGIQILKGGRKLTYESYYLFKQDWRIIE